MTKWQKSELRLKSNFKDISWNCNLKHRGNFNYCLTLCLAQGQFTCKKSCWLKKKPPLKQSNELKCKVIRSQKMPEGNWKGNTMWPSLLNELWSSNCQRYIPQCSWRLLARLRGSTDLTQTQRVTVWKNLLKLTSSNSWNNWTQIATKIFFIK